VKVVLDTNILVSAFLKPASAPDLVLQRAIRGELTAVVDQRILAEYVHVLGRPKFGFDQKDVLRILLRLLTTGQRVQAVARTTVTLADPDDLPFLEVAIASGAAIVTGNTRHFAGNLPARVVSPRQLLDELGPGRIVIRALPYNIEQRFDGDWARVDDDSMLAGTVDEWEKYCAEKGFKLVVERVEREAWDPVQSALENLHQMEDALPSPRAKGQEPPFERRKLSEVLELTLRWAFPIPRRFSGLKGLLRMLHSIAQKRGASDAEAARAISSALLKVVAQGGDTVEEWDVCGLCGREFRYRRFSWSLIMRMLGSGYGALCDRCS
jgi:putative PIN family toxin of toxin-antitoxin system